jgi:hypothetical protein
VSASHVLRGAVAAGLVTVAGIELLSALSLVTVPMAAVVGLAAIAVGAVVGKPWRAWPRLELGLEPIAIGLLAAVTLVTAVVAGPNTWDSMTYHLPRIDHWLAAGSVAHYPTAIDRQLWQPPFGEYLVLVARAWTGGGDRLANLVQWGASLGTALAAARIAELLGVGRRARWLAALLVATAPTVVLQATSTQTDLLGAFWVATAAALVLEAIGNPEGPLPWFWIGGAVALGIGTKGTALVFGLPWLAALALAVGRRPRAIGALAGAAGLVVALNAPWMARNQATYGSPLGDPVVQRLLRPASWAPRSLASNLVANASVHWALPGEPARRAAEGVLNGFNRLLGADPAVLYPYFGGLRVEPWSTDEDLAGNPLLFWATVAAAALAIRRRAALGSAERIAWAATLGGLVLFGLLVRWQPFNGRLQMAGFALAAPLVAAAADRAGAYSGRIVAVLAALAALPPLLLNTIRPTIGAGSVFRRSRAEQYFARQPHQVAAYSLVVGRLIETRCYNVAIKTGYDSWEYPLWALSRQAGAGIRFDHVEVDNPSGRIAAGSPPRCGLVAIDQKPEWSPGAAFTGWSLVGRGDRFSLWLPARPPP